MATGQTYKQGEYSINKSRISVGNRVLPIFFPVGGVNLSNYPGYYLVGGRLCKLGEVSDIDTEFKNERDGFEVGKISSEFNDGTKFSCTLTGQGNALELQALLTGHDLNAVAGVAQGQSVYAVGHMALVRANDDGIFEFTQFMKNVNVKLTTVAGASDGESTMEIALSTEDDVFMIGQFAFPVHEIFFDGTSEQGATIVNTAAPDGVHLTFTLGAGNEAGVSVIPLALAFNPDQSGAARYLAEVRINGVAISSGYTFNAATSVLTFTTAPADGAKLEIFYFVRSSAKVWSSSRQYGIGEIVLATDNASYKSKTVNTNQNPAGGTNTTNWDQFFYDVAGAETEPVVPFTSGVLSLYESLNSKHES